VGFAVNKAARVASAAVGGQIVVSSVVKELIGFDPSVRFGNSFFAELRGIDGIHALVPVEWSASSDDRGESAFRPITDDFLIDRNGVVGFGEPPNLPDP
jgi:hypothetical protein